MASQLTDALDRVVVALRDAGLTASTDHRNIHHPGVWVTPHDLTADLAGNLRVRAALYLIGPAGAGRNRLDQIGRLLDLVTDLVTFDEPPTYVVVAELDQPAIRIVTTTD